MSHFTNLKTRFQNLFYLEKALNRLAISYKTYQETNPPSLEKRYATNISILQRNNHSINFCWNGNEYDLVVDMSFWDQQYPIETFIDKIAQEYAGELIIGESQKVGFQPIKYEQNKDGSNTLVLERWNQL